MYMIIPVDQISTLLEYSFLSATSGAIKISVPQCWSSVVKDTWSYLTLKPKSAIFIVDRSLASPIKMLSNREMIK